MPAVTTKESEALAASGGQQTATCDRCRVLKVKCLPPENEEGSSTGSRKAPCRRCHRAGHDCTFDYSFKRSGRPLGKANKSKSTRSPSERRSASRPISPPSSSGPSRERLLSGSVGDSRSPAIPLSSITHSDSYPPPPPPRSSARNDSTDYSDIGHFTPADNNIHQSDDVNAQSHFWGPPKDSIFGSARMTFEAADYHYPFGEWTHGVYSRRPSFDYTTPPSHMAQRTGPSPLTGPSPAFSAGGQSHVSFDNNMPARQRPSTGEVSNVSHVDTGSRSFGQQPQIVPQELFNALPDAPPAPQVESIGSWSEFCFFFSLWMRHQHSLVPLVHKPTFAMDVLHRRDQRDEPFRALLFSIVTYTICQCPINVMSSDFSRERLLALLQQCQKASRRIQLEYQSRPSLILAASTAMDILSSQATNRPDLTSVLFSDAQRIIYTLHLNQVETLQATSLIDIEVGRRIFWQVYSTDKTNVMNGGNMLFNNQEGVPPLPLDVEDERITSTGVVPSSSSTAGGFTNYIAGFIAVVQIFRILGECQLRHRTLLNDPTASQDPLALLQWVQHAVSRLQSITDSLPVDLRAKRTTIGPDGKSKAINVTLNTTPDSAATAGIQQANIFITAMCAEFALLDFRTALNPEEDLRSQRETIAKKAYETLSSIPIEYLASNGEAMRGKVLRTILALFNASTSPEELGDSVWDWWSMYSQVQFIQVIPTGQ